MSTHVSFGPTSMHRDLSPTTMRRMRFSATLGAENRLYVAHHAARNVLEVFYDPDVLNVFCDDGEHFWMHAQCDWVVVWIHGAVV